MLPLPSGKGTVCQRIRGREVEDAGLSQAASIVGRDCLNRLASSVQSHPLPFPAVGPEKEPVPVDRPDLLLPPAVEASPENNPPVLQSLVVTRP